MVGCTPLNFTSPDFYFVCVPSSGRVTPPLRTSSPSTRGRQDEIPPEIERGPRWEVYKFGGTR